MARPLRCPRTPNRVNPRQEKGRTRTVRMAIQPRGFGDIPQRTERRMTWPAKVSKQIEERSGGICEGCGEREATEKHHRKYKSRGGKDTLENALHVCGFGNNAKEGCHGEAHEDP